MNALLNVIEQAIDVFYFVLFTFNYVLEELKLVYKALKNVFEIKKINLFGDSLL